MSIFLGADTNLEIGVEKRLQLVTGVATDTATCTVRLVDDHDDTEIEASIDVPEVVGTKGLYRGIIPDNQSGLVIGQLVRLEWTADDGAGRKMFKHTFEQVVRAK